MARDFDDDDDDDGIYLENELSDDEIDSIMNESVIPDRHSLSVPLSMMDHGTASSPQPPTDAAPTLSDALAPTVGFRTGFAFFDSTPAEQKRYADSVQHRKDVLANAWRTTPLPAPKWSGLSGDSLYAARKSALSSAWAVGKPKPPVRDSRPAPQPGNAASPEPAGPSPQEAFLHAQSLHALTNDQLYQNRCASLRDRWRHP